ncbi:MAG: hypothetical protein U0892_22490 [Pirellulales bacterium]
MTAATVGEDFAVVDLAEVVLVLTVDAVEVDLAFGFGFTNVAARLAMLETPRLEEKWE